MVEEWASRKGKELDLDREIRLFASRVLATLFIRRINDDECLFLGCLEVRSIHTGLYKSEMYSEGRSITTS
jgi:hypothetical protein